MHSILVCVMCHVTILRGDGDGDGDGDFREVVFVLFYKPRENLKRVEEYTSPQ